MNHILNLDADTQALFEVFNKMAEGKSTLLLGAGASISEKKYLSNEIIKYYQEAIHKELDTNDIIEFVDMLSSSSDFSRSNFDNFVADLLNKLPVTEAHKILATVPWKEIITTNYDLLVEKSFDLIKNTSEKNLDLVPIRSQKEFFYNPSNSEVKLIKLNGCLSDKGKFPLVFSTKDFEKVKSFYKVVLQELKNLSFNDIFISIGYSFSDLFSKQLLKKYDDCNYREKKWLYSVDIGVNDSQLEYFTENRICVIRTTFSDFFNRYKKWKSNNNQILVSTKRISFSSPTDNTILLPPELALKINNTVQQLNSKYSLKNSSAKEFYMGEEPSYETILKQFDVTRSHKIKEVKSKINELNTQVNHSNLVPIVFLEGTFGTGKSTFAYRLIKEMQTGIDNESIAFEVTDFTKLSSVDLLELFKHCRAKHVYLLFNFVERDSIFKALLDIRLKMSIEQASEFSVTFIAPIRENILERYKNKMSIKNIIEINIDSSLNTDEINDLLNKLQDCNLISYRDQNEKSNLSKLIKTELDSDSFILFLSLINGNHIHDLKEAFGELPKIAQSAFLYTALLHRFKILMPSTLLKSIVSSDWDSFIKDVIKVDCKGILIQIQNDSRDIDSDIYFRTKHAIIADKLIKEIIKSEDELYSMYKNIFSRVISGQKTTRITSDLLKAIREGELFDSVKVNKLYDIAHAQLSNDPYFLLQYSINLQYRGDKLSLKKGIDSLVIADSLIDYRSHRFIHRRGVLNFELAKNYFNSSADLNLVYRHIDEAEELFNIKKVLDPCSFYSYKFYLELQMWKLDNILSDNDELLRLKILIEEDFETAERIITDNLDGILELRKKYIEKYNFSDDPKEYLNMLENFYKDFNRRPYALLLKYNYLMRLNRDKDALNLIEEIESFNDNNEISKFLFKYYGRNLHIISNRMKFYSLIKNNLWFEKSESLRYYYFKFIADSYNRYFEDAQGYLKMIHQKFNHLNPDFKNLWLNSDSGQPEIFDAILVKNASNQFHVRILELQKSFSLVNQHIFNFKSNDKIKVKLHFFLYGIRAEIMKVKQKLPKGIQINGDKQNIINHQS